MDVHTVHCPPALKTTNTGYRAWSCLASFSHESVTEYFSRCGTIYAAWESPPHPRPSLHHHSPKYACRLHFKLPACLLRLSACTTPPPTNENLKIDRSIHRHRPHAFPAYINLPHHAHEEKLSTSTGRCQNASSQRSRQPAIVCWFPS